MNIIVTRPGQKPESVKVGEGGATLTLETLQDLVGGYIEIIHPDNFPSYVQLVCNEEGKIRRLPANRYVTVHGWPDIVCGTFVLCASGIVDGEPDLIPFTDEQTKTVLRLCGCEA